MLMDTKRDDALYITAVSEVYLSKVFLDDPYDTKLFCSNHNYWAKDQYFEMRMLSRASNPLLFAGWHNVEIHEILESRRESFYVSVENWWGRLETSPHLTVPTPPVFAYYSQVARGYIRGREAVMSISVSEFVVMTIVSVSQYHYMA